MAILQVPDFEENTMKASHQKIIAMLREEGNWLESPGFYTRMYSIRGPWNGRGCSRVCDIQRRTIEEMQKLGLLVMRPVDGRNTLVLAEENAEHGT